MSSTNHNPGILRRSAIVPGLLAAIAVAGCDDDPVTPEAGTIVEVAVATPQLTTLVTALQTADLTATLEGNGPFTVFAPTNPAFDALPAGTVDALLAAGNADVLTDLLTYHVVAGELTASDLSDGETLTTVEGGTLTVTVDAGVVRVDGAAVTTADVEASNGVVHLVDGVLTGGLDAVQRARVTADLSTLVSLVGEADLGAALTAAGPFTIFAPVNSAFAALDPATVEALLADENQAQLQQILTYHVVPGRVLAGDLTDGAMVTTLEGGQVTIDLDGGAKVNDAAIVATDILVSNGVVHLIDGVLMP